MSISDRAAVWLGSILSVVVGIWALGAVAFPFGIVGGAAAALFGLAFARIAVHARATTGCTAPKLSSEEAGDLLNR